MKLTDAAKVAAIAIIGIIVFKAVAGKVAFLQPIAGKI